MKKSIILLLTLFIVKLIAAQSELKVMTYNIRYDNRGDGLNRWELRKNKLLQLVHSRLPDVIGTQEVLFNQAKDLLQGLSEYRMVGVGREDGKTKGEFAAIFYNAQSLTCLDSGNFWLSDTPDKIGSIGWDAALTRMVTWCKFKRKADGKLFFVFNTHFDHAGKEARRQSALLINRQITLITKGLPVIVTGDLNALPNEPPIAAFLSNPNNLMKDAAGDNEDATFCGFDIANLNCKRIDYIFYSAAFKVRDYLVISENNGTYYPSDHKAVMAIFKF